MKLSIKAGSASQSLNIFVADSSSTTGAGLTGVLFSAAGLTAFYALPRATPVSITLATLAAVTSAYSSGGFREIDATNMPGWYRFDVPDAALASGRFVSLHLKGANNMAPLPIEIQLTAWDNQDATRGGLANLDAAVSTRSTYAGADTAGTTTLLSRLTAPRALALDFLDAAVSGVPASVWAATTRTLTSFGTMAADAAAAVWAAAARTLTSFGFPVVAANVLTAGETADAVWDEPAAAHVVSGSTGAALAAAAAGGGGSTADPVAIAETLLKLDWTTVVGEANRSVLSALRTLRNRVSIADNGDGTGTITVTKEDDSAVAWTAVCVFDGAARPISGVDPA
jgi:hypothetical protein